MAKLTFRQAGRHDRDFAYEVKRAALREVVERVWGWDEAVQRELHERRFSEQEVQVIRWDGVDVGILSAAVARDGVRVQQLFLLPDYQSQGIGTQCMRRVMGQARALALPVRLQVLKVNPRARVFYQRLGFVATGETETHDLMEWEPGVSPQGARQVD